MDYIFYFIFLLVLSLVENPRIFNITAHIELRKKIKNEEFGPEQFYYTILYILYFILGVMGFLTSQWLGFLILFLSGFLLSLIKKISKSETFEKTILIIDAIISVFIGLFIVLNKFHFQIPNKEILNWIGL